MAGRSTGSLDSIGGNVDTVASTKFTGIRSNGERIVIQFEVGRPYLRGKHGADDWACPLSLTPLYRNLADSGSNDPVHALCLAISLALQLLGGFREDGGRLEYDDGTEVPLEAFAFGISAQGGSNAV